MARRTVLIALALSVVVVATTGAWLWLQTELFEQLDRAARLDRVERGETVAEDLAADPGLLPLATRAMLERGQPRRALRLLDRAPTPSPVWRAAALTDLGEPGLAMRAWTVPAGDMGGFEQRVADALALLQQGTVARIFDRHGQPLAHRTSDGVLHRAADIPLELFPEEAAAVSAELGATRTTLDVGLSRRLLRSLYTYRGAVVVLDVDSGEILAAVGRDWRNRARPPTDRVGHALLTQQREPASIAKLVTTTAGWRNGLDVDDEIKRMRCSGAVFLDGEPLYCTSIGGPLRGGLRHALATSCNVAFGTLGDHLGRAAVVDEYRRFGFDGADPGTTSLHGYLHRSQLSARELGDVSIGLNHLEITPLHAAVFARTFVDGYRIQPRLVRAADGLLGLTQHSRQALPDLVRATFPAPERILEPQWLEEIHDAMGAVVGAYGTASGISPSGFPVAMKTGTGQTEGSGFHVNYVGFAPADDPQFAFAIRITHGRTSKSVRTAARRATRDVLRALAQHSPTAPAEPWPSILAGR